MKKTKLILVLSLALMLIVGAGLGAGTYAYFTKELTSNNNVIQVDSFNPSSDFELSTVEVTEFFPGANAFVHDFAVFRNDTRMDMYYDVTIDLYPKHRGDNGNPITTDKYLFNNPNVKYYFSWGSDEMILLEDEDGYLYIPTYLCDSDEDISEAHLKIHWPYGDTESDSTDNDFIGARGKYSISLVATQVNRNNETNPATFNKTVTEKTTVKIGENEPENAKVSYHFNYNDHKLSLTVLLDSGETIEVGEDTPLTFSPEDATLSANGGSLTVYCLEASSSIEKHNLTNVTVD